MIEVLAIFSFVFGIGFLLILKEISSALEKRASAEEAMVKAKIRHAESIEKMAQEINLIRQYYAHAVEKQWDAVR